MSMHEKMDSFQKKIEQMVLAAGKDVKDSPGPAGHSETDHIHGAYQESSRKILKEMIEPRIDLVGEAFASASHEVHADLGYIRLSFSEKGVAIPTYLLFCLMEGDHGKSIGVYAECCLRPFSNRCEPSASISLSLDAPNYPRVEAFIEDYILAFLKKYLLYSAGAGEPHP